ncbi:alpha/beta hydrolase [Halobiforma lacisalsi AJ5]|uniref:Alpha/beta hydrolase n=1 Tax=Natronobacterium lacisalsi AJ5 TaxID=358396 RepID=M0LNV7_NATLA|nr:alpha/beta hydrolase [Halobiforma lacisalsi]APW99338.1 alpha/beta hydrolase [Halobiforma lacisalsi AJ5]EMA35232.1 alpha/beta hydrolase fold protein [Halobiforma lacisalsi AJ5]
MPETHDVPVADGESVVAVHHRPDSSATASDRTDHGATDAWFVCCHGFLSDKSGSYERRCRRAAAEGYEAVRFDFRGCGDADGSFADATLGNRIADLEAVLEYFDPPSTVLFGSSFGGKVAFHAALDREDVAAIVARAPVTYARAFDNYRATVHREGECRFDEGRSIDGRFFEDLDSYAFENVVNALSVPVLIVHGREDGSVAIEDSFEAARRLETDVLLRAVPGEGHRFSSVAEDRLLESTVDWLARLDV